MVNNREQEIAELRKEIEELKTSKNLWELAAMQEREKVLNHQKKEE